jgi:DNA-directed RNA polymerase specialized sigma24 family protein
MEHNCQMTLFYRQYKKKHIDENGLAACIFNYILSSRSNEYGLFFRNGGDRADFLCWLYPRLLNSIRNYRKDGGTFDAYIATVVRYSCREYNSLNERAYLAENIYSMDCARESEAREPEEAYEQEASGAPAGLSPAQMLVVMLKSYYFVTDELVSKAAPVIGIDADVLGGMIDTLHRLRLKKEAQAAKLTSGIHRLYYRRLEYEKRIEAKFEDKTVCSAISARVERIRLRMDRMRKRLKAMRLEATNKEVAEVLGLPKGTVDSRLAIIKSKTAAPHKV